MPLQVQRQEVAARWLATWQAAVPPSGHPRLYGAADNWSPFNGGLWTLAHPSRALYELGLALLECTSWNATHGFNLMGRPRKLSNAYPRVRQMLVPSTQLHVKDTRRKTRAYGENTWDFYASEYDQGFYFYLFFVATDIGRHLERRSTAVHSSKCGNHASNTWRRYIGKLEGAAARTVNVTARGRSQSVTVRPSAGISPEAALGGCPHMARHCLGTVKPWKRTKRGSVDLNLGRVATYLLTVRYQHLVNSSRCARYFAKQAEDRAINATMHAILQSGNVDVGGHPQQVR